MTDALVPVRHKRRPRISSRVVRSFWLTTRKEKPDLWPGRHVVVNEMTCGHQLRATTNRLLLRGELRRCRWCEKAADQAPQDLPFGGV